MPMDPTTGQSVDGTSTEESSECVVHFNGRICMNSIWFLVCVAEHSLFDVYEVISFDQSLLVEPARLYITVKTLLDEAKLALLARNQKLDVKLNTDISEDMKSVLVDHILQHIQVTHRSETRKFVHLDVKTIKIAEESQCEETYRPTSITCRVPEFLIPYECDFANMQR